MNNPGYQIKFTDEENLKDQRYAEGFEAGFRLGWEMALEQYQQAMENLEQIKQNGENEK